MIYLAQFTLHQQDYPNRKSEKEMMRLVEAENEDTAEAKLIKHYERESDPYCVSYSVRSITIHPTIT